MRFGIVLPTYPAGATVEGVARVAKEAERLGFVSAWTTDHVILPIESAGPYSEILEPLMTLAYLAPVTSTIRLGISVIVVPQRQGIVLAKQLATLDLLCGGRLIVGVGAGWNREEFRMLERDDVFLHRGAHLNETLRLWRHLWTTPEDGFSGQYYEIPGVAFRPLPAQAGGPPVWVGGSSLSARRRAAQFGAAWHPVGVSAPDLLHLSDGLRGAAVKLGTPIPEVAPRLPIQIGGNDVGPMTAGRHQVLQGESEQVVAMLQEYEQLGVAEIDCLFGSSDDGFVINQMQRFSSEVMTHFVP
jgi:probable F420-dependent oxidoreductase